MKRALHEKEELLTMLTEIYDQLGELELDLQASFSDLRTRLKREQLNKISAPEQRLSEIEVNIEQLNLAFSSRIYQTSHQIMSHGV